MPTFQGVVYNLRDTFGGFSFMETLKDVGRTAELTGAEQSSVQERRLSALLGECFEYVEAYRPYRSLRNKAKSYPFEVLAELPVLTRDIYRKDPHAYFNPNLKSGQLAQNWTRKTAGYSYPVSKAARSADFAAHMWAYSKLGLTYTAKHIALQGRLTEQNLILETFKSLKRGVVENEMLSLGSYISANKLSRYAQQLGNTKLGYCVGEPSVMAALARLFEQNGVSFTPSYKALVTAGETLFDEERELIQRVFKAPVYSSYYTRDDGLIACECEHGGLHVIENNFIIEEIDGRVIVTNLYNNAAPRMRYAAPETGKLTSEPCECGREGKRFTSLVSRKNPLHTASDGRVIPGGVLDAAAERHYNIVRYKLTQPDPQHAELVVELRTSAALDEAAALHKQVCSLMPGTLVDLKSTVAR